MEAICDFENVETAARAVMRNKGAPGVDGMTVKHYPAFLRSAGRRLRASLSRGAIVRNR